MDDKITATCITLLIVSRCPWDEKICLNAVKYDNMNMLQWGDKTYQLALAGGNKFGLRTGKKPNKRVIEYLNDKLKEKNIK